MTDRLDLVVAEWARRSPDATAVLCDGDSIGYAELVDRAETVAFRHKESRPGDVIPVATGRSVELVVELLGCVRADLTPVVLDPGWPPWCTEDVLDLATAQSTSDTAFLALTPGARPHPVAVSHKEILTALADTGLPAPRIQQTAPLGSAEFWHEVWAALLNGGCVVLAPPADVLVQPHLPSRPAEETLTEQPRTPEPDGLLAEVRGILGHATLTPDDDLLDAGMNSLAAIRLATVLSVRSGRKVTVGDIYRERRLTAFPDATAEAPGPVAPVDDGHRPLSHAQKRFLFAEAYAPGSADNIVIEAYELTGPLRPDVLRAALGDVVARHAALSTVYVWERGQPVQRVLTDTAVSWTEVPPPEDGLPVRDIAERITSDLWDTPFRLDRDLPVRARLCRIAADHALLCLQFHHIAFDGSSELPLLDDLRHAYVTRAEGDLPRFPPESGYALLGRQEERELASWAADDLPYWRETLANCPPSCLPNGEAEATANETVRHLDTATVRGLAVAAARCAGPPLAALSAGAAMALAREFGVDDVCVGTLTAGRFDPAMDQLVGYLVNPFAVPLRGVRRDAGAVLADAARQVVAGLEHARTPFDELVRELNTGRGAHPWFEAWVVLQHPPPDMSLGPVGLRPVRVRPPRTSRSWLVEAFPLADGGWDLVTTWRADVMTDETGAALADGAAAALAELART